MKTLVLSLVLLLGGSLAFAVTPEQPSQKPPADVTAETWPGVLVDWDCKSRDPEPVCPVGAATKHFGLVIDGGRILELDERGNDFAREAISAAKTGGNVDVVILGSRSGKLLAVTELRVEPGARDW